MLKNAADIRCTVCSASLPSQGCQPLHRQAVPPLPPRPRQRPLGPAASRRTPPLTAAGPAAPETSVTPVRAVPYSRPAPRRGTVPQTLFCVYPGAGGTKHVSAIRRSMQQLIAWATNACWNPAAIAASVGSPMLLLISEFEHGTQGKTGSGCCTMTVNIAAACQG